MLLVLSHSSEMDLFQHEILCFLMFSPCLTWNSEVYRGLLENAPVAIKAWRGMQHGIQHGMAGRALRDTGCDRRNGPPGGSSSPRSPGTEKFFMSNFLTFEHFSQCQVRKLGKFLPQVLQQNAFLQGLRHPNLARFFGWSMHQLEPEERCPFCLWLLVFCWKQSPFNPGPSVQGKEERNLKENRIENRSI